MHWNRETAHIKFWDRFFNVTIIATATFILLFVVCEVGSWGPDCAYTCDCVHASHCDPANGCICRTGWEGLKCSINKDECALEIQACGTREECVDTEGSYTCECRSGFHRSDTGECES